MEEDRGHLEGAVKAPSVDWRVAAAVVALGMTSLVTQVILLRDFLSVFYGNELVIGIILGNWMVLTGIGSYVGRLFERVRKLRDLATILVGFLAILPLLTLFLLRYLRNIVFPVGTMIDIVQILSSSFILLLPYCLVSGSAFALFARLVSEESRTNRITSVYAWESLGSVIGGLLFNSLLIFFLNAFQSLVIILVVDLAIALTLSLSSGASRTRFLIPIIALVVLFPALYFNLDEMTKRFLFKDQDVLYSRDTPYGSLTVTQQADQKNFYQNNVLLSSTNDVTTSEESVHYAMVQHPHPRVVLLVSGAISGAVKEILKYGVEKIDYVEIDPWLIDIARHYTDALSAGKINVINEDPRRYIRRASERYDIALINAPEPSTAQANRYYTVEFFKELKRRLNPGAVISLGLLSSTDYLSDESRQINSVLYNTLKSSFANILIVPGLRTYFLASDSSLSVDIARLVDARGLKNDYVNQYYLDDQVLEQRSRSIERTLDQGAQVNEDFVPISYYRQVLYWLSYFQSSSWVVAVLSMIALVFVALNINAISFGVFTGGIAASSVEILLLLSFQIVYGYVYQMLGFIVTVFMAGLAVGAMYARRKLHRPTLRGYVGIQFVVGVYCVLLPLALLWLRDETHGTVVVHFIFLLLTFALACIVGTEFAMASKLRSGSVTSIASELYSIDLMGSAIGAFAVTAYLVPLIGIINVSMIVGALSFVSGTTLWVRRKGIALST
jgi:spermidine synthase